MPHSTVTFSMKVMQSYSVVLLLYVQVKHCTCMCTYSIQILILFFLLHSTPVRDWVWVLLRFWLTDSYVISCTLYVMQISDANSVKRSTQRCEVVNIKISSIHEWREFLLGNNWRHSRQLLNILVSLENDKPLVPFSWLYCCDVQFW